MSQKEIIKNYLEWHLLNDIDGGWVVSWKLEKNNTPFGWIGTSGLRRCRELVEEGVIEARPQGIYVEYRFKEYLLPRNLVQRTLV